jgi:hypothetical protein
MSRPLKLIHRGGAVRRNRRPFGRCSRAPRSRRRSLESRRRCSRLRFSPPSCAFARCSACRSWPFSSVRRLGGRVLAGRRPGPRRLVPEPVCRRTGRWVGCGGCHGHRLQAADSSQVSLFAGRRRNVGCGAVSLAGAPAGRRGDDLRLRHLAVRGGHAPLRACPSDEPACPPPAARRRSRSWPWSSASPAGEIQRGRARFA